MAKVADLAELAEKLETTGGKVWVAAEASEPHVRVYWGEHYVAVYDRGDEYTWEFCAAPGTAHMRGRKLGATYKSKVEAAL